MDTRIEELEARVEQLEKDDVFAASSAVSTDASDRLAKLSSTNNELRAENERLQSLLAKQEYRIVHLVRALESFYSD